MGKSVQKFPDHLKDYIGNCNVANYLEDYLDDIGARTYVIEENYIDKDYFVDYQGFYSRSFKQYERLTTRIHFFKDDFSVKDFQSLIKRHAVNKLQDAYLGFIVVKPIYDVKKNPLIGRTLVNHYPEQDGTKSRCFIEPVSDCNLYGIPLEINSLPFQRQDRRVSACATIALWTSLFPLFDFFEIEKQSPSEITGQSTLFPAPFRKFPASGLTLEQILNYIGQTGLDTEVLIEPEGNKISLAARAYIQEAKLPILALLKLTDNKGKDTYHAAVISGYKCNKKGKIEELYVHDDGIGPYSRVVPVSGDFKLWKNEWITNFGKTRVIVKYLIIPVYPKIRLTFPRILAFHDRYFRRILGMSGIRTEVFLTYVQKYKEFLSKQKTKDKWEHLTSPLPRFIWVGRVYHNNKLITDTLVDATSVFAEPLKTIIFE